MVVHTTRIRGKTVTVHLLDDEDYEAAYDRHGIEGAAWYSPWAKARGWERNRNVYVKRSARGLRRLLAHEIGHALGHAHTPWPTVMNFTGLLRWFDPDGLLPYADRVLEEMNHG